MNSQNGTSAASYLADLLKSPDDLDKLPSLRADMTRKKATVDSQLKLGLSEQLSLTQSGMSNINTAQQTVAAIKEEMMKIDKLCAEAQGMIHEFPDVNKMSIMQRNFAAVEGVKGSVDRFADELTRLEGMLAEDDQDLENQPNLLAIHEGLSGLRDVRDQAMDQVKGSSEGESGLELIENLPLEGGATLRDYFAKLDEVVDWFDEHVGQACLNLIPLVQSGNNGLVVRLALVIEEEEKKDRQVKALQDAQREFQDVASRFKSINVGQRELRGYKKKFFEAIKFAAQPQFDTVKDAFLEDPERLEKSCRWFFNDLNTVKLGMVDLMPKKWKIFRTYTNIYHNLMHDFLTTRLDDPDITPVHMLAILNWVGKYYTKMQKLGFSQSQLAPHVIDEREADLVRDYRTLITQAVEQWMDRMSSSDREVFLRRDENSFDTDADGHFHTKTLSDMWRMLREQLAVAESSGRPDVVEGVVDSMLRSLKQRQQTWEILMDTEVARFESAPDPTTLEGFNTLQDHLVAIANDQITNIDDQPGVTSFLTRFRKDYEPLVSPAYALSSQAELDSLRDGYVDLGTHCISLFVRLIFASDLSGAVKDFFTPQWLRQEVKIMETITLTFEDYLNDYFQVLHPSLKDVLVEELSDELLVRYLSAVRNKNAKFRRLEPFTEVIKSDIMAVFTYFQNHPDSFEEIKGKWRAVSAFGDLLSAEKGDGAIDAYDRMKQAYWDVQIGWVEAVLRSRDDFDRAMLSSVKAKAAEMSGERGTETVMGKVK